MDTMLQNNDAGCRAALWWQTNENVGGMLHGKFEILEILDFLWLIGFRILHENVLLITNYSKLGLE